MFKIKILTLVIAVFLFVSNQYLYSTSFNLNTTGERNFEINYKVSQPQIFFTSNAPLEDIKGSVNSEFIKGTIFLDAANIENTNGTVSFDVKGMETGIQKRNGHLSSKNWLDAETYPAISFSLIGLSGVKVASTDLTRGRATANAIASGNIKMHGKEKLINLDVTITFIKESELTKKRTPGDFLSVSGKFEVELSDYDIKGTEGIIGNKVANTINIEFELFFAGNPNSNN